MNKKERRQSRAQRVRQRCKNPQRDRLCVLKTSRHIYAQLISHSGHVLAQASSLEKEVKNSMINTGNILAAELIGKLIAERSVQHGITQVYLDCSGFKYHGRIKGLADMARAHGLNF